MYTFQLLIQDPFTMRGDGKPPKEKQKKSPGFQFKAISIGSTHWVTVGKEGFCRDPWAKPCDSPEKVTVTGCGVDPNYPQQLFLNTYPTHWCFFAVVCSRYVKPEFLTCFMAAMCVFFFYFFRAQRLAPKKQRQGPSCPKAVYPLWHMVCRINWEWSSTLPFDGKKVEGNFGRFVLSASRNVGAPYFVDPRVVSDRWLVRFPACK